MKRLALLLGVLAVGCVPPTVDLHGRRCPCAEGWVCRDDVCITEAEARFDAGRADAGGADAGAVDAGAVDAGAVDAGGMDAGGMDAGGMDAGGMDAGIVDAGSDAGATDSGAGATGCDGPLASAIVCDGFESAPGPWTGRTERLGTVSRSTAFAEVGAYALAASTTDLGGEASFRYDALGGFTSGDLWVRASVYVPSAAAIDDFTFFSIGELASPFEGISLGIGSDGHAGSYSTISSDYVWNPMVTPRDRWVCFELHVGIDATAGVIEVYMDGALAASETGLDTVPGAGFGHASTGVDYAGPAQGPITVYIDEFALSTSRLACP